MVHICHGKPIENLKWHRICQAIASCAIILSKNCCIVLTPSFTGLVAFTSLHFCHLVWPLSDRFTILSLPYQRVSFLVCRDGLVHCHIVCVVTIRVVEQVVLLYGWRCVEWSRPCKDVLCVKNRECSSSLDSHSERHTDWGKNLLLSMRLCRRQSCHVELQLKYRIRL